MGGKCEGRERRRGTREETGGMRGTSEELGGMLGDMRGTREEPGDMRGTKEELGDMRGTIEEKESISRRAVAAAGRRRGSSSRCSIRPVVVTDSVAARTLIRYSSGR